MIIVQLDSEQLSNLIENAVRKAIGETPASNSTTTDIWFDLPELCNYLPEKPAKATVYGWIHNSSIPYHKRAKKVFFLKSEIDEWLKAGRKKTFVEIQKEANQYLISKRA
ncbi:MAG: helix-turn-helix domain-containing protein [Cytophagaceae bacterium]